MAKERAKPATGIGVRAVEREVLATAHELAAALHRVGAMDALSMREMDRLCLPPPPESGAQ